jgi:hypothetical protein
LQTRHCRRIIITTTNTAADMFPAGGTDGIRRAKSCMTSALSSNKDGGPAASSSYSFELKKVIFDEIRIREYPRILGDNPAVSEGEIDMEGLVSLERVLCVTSIFCSSSTVLFLRHFLR